MKLKTWTLMEPHSPAKAKAVSSAVASSRAPADIWQLAGRVLPAKQDGPNAHRARARDVRLRIGSGGWLFAEFVIPRRRSRSSKAAVLPWMTMTAHCGQLEVFI